MNALAAGGDEGWGGGQVVNSVVGLERRERFDVVMAGDDVPRKKPDPIIYQVRGSHPPSRRRSRGLLIVCCFAITHVPCHMWTVLSAIAQMASERVGVSPENCVVIEDSLVGLRAAKGAGLMSCPSPIVPFSLSPCWNAILRWTNRSVHARSNMRH